MQPGGGQSVDMETVRIGHHAVPDGMIGKWITKTVRLHSDKDRTCFYVCLDF